MLKRALERALPAWITARVRRNRRRREMIRRSRLPPLTEDALRAIVRDDLGLEAGDVVFVHASIGRLAPRFDAYGMLGLLEETVGPEGTLLFPTYPKERSLAVLRAGEVFDVRTAPSFTGLLSEVARRNGAAR